MCILLEKQSCWLAEAQKILLPLVRVAIVAFTLVLLLALVVVDVITFTLVTLLRCCVQVAYVPQSAFIYNASVRDNILFGLPFEQERYEEAIAAAAVRPDLDNMPGHPRCWSLVRSMLLFGRLFHILEIRCKPLLLVHSFFSQANDHT